MFHTSVRVIESSVGIQYQGFKSHFDPEMAAISDDIRGVGFDPGLMEELIRVKNHGSRSDGELSSMGRQWIETHADYVDEVILKVGKRTEACKNLPDSVRKDFLLYLLNPGSRQYLSTLTSEGRVEFIWRYFTGVHIPAEVIQKYEKNSDTSRQLRDRGTELYKQRNFHDALHYYNLASMFAEKGTESAGIAYANRSAVLVEMGQFEEALEDVELALQNKYPESRLQKLDQRRKKCQESIQKKLQDYLAIDAKVRQETEAEIRDMKNVRNEILQLKKTNALIPAAADCVEIKFDKNQGRHLVVNRDVTPGTVLIVEDPYIFTLHGLSKWDTFHCHHCLKRIRRGVPCENCVFAIYCNEYCRMETDTIHRYECKCLPSFHAIYAVDQILIGVRAILKAGQQELCRLFKTRDPQYFNPQQPFGTEADYTYDSQSYLSVFHLVTNSDRLDCIQRLTNVKHALVATTILETKTEFFNGIPVNCKLEFKKFVAALMLRHIEAEAVNAAAMIEIRGLEDVSFVDSFSGKIHPQKLSEQINSLQFGKFAGGMYPLFSLLNHSCDPNVHYLNDVVHGKMVVMAHRTLKQGEPLLISYNGGFTFVGIEDRQTELDERYSFQCRCVACEQNWPTLFELQQDQSPIFCCPGCSKSFFEYEKGSEEFKKTVLTPPRWKCGRCGKKYKKDELRRRLDVNMRLANEIYRLMELNRPLKAFDIFPKVFDFFQYHLCPPDAHMHHLQELYIKTLAPLLYYAQ